MHRALCLAAVVGCTQRPPPPAPPADVSGATAVTDPLKRGALFVDEENDAVLLATEKNGVHEYPCRWPSQVIADARGTVWAACRGEGVVRRITAPRAEFHVGPEPRALALDDARRRLYVALATSNEVVMLDADSGVALKRVKTRTEPTAVALFGRHLVVASRKSSELELFPRELGAGLQTVKLSPGKPGLSGNDSLGVEHLVHARDKLAIVATVASLGDASQPTYYGGFNSTPFSQELFVLGPDLHPESLGSVALPDVASATYLDQSWTGGLLLLASRGLAKGAVVELNVRPEHRGERRTAMVDAWHTLPSGLAGIADDGERSWAFVESTRTILVAPSGSEVAVSEVQQAQIRLTREDPRRVVATRGTVQTLKAPPSRLDSDLAAGRQLFHTATNPRVAQGAVACASCHRDGRDDGRTWAGQGAFRETPALAGRDLAHTAPYGWNGEYPTLQQYIAFTIKERLRGTGLSAPDLEALARYVRSGLHRVDRPAVALSRSATHGKALFESDQLGCTTCHPADGTFADGARHDVGSLSGGERVAWTRSHRGVAGEASSTFDTPSLLGLGLTAPYLHDGSASTLGEVFKRLGNHMGQVEQLSSSERDSLVAYLATL